LSQENDPSGPGSGPNPTAGSPSAMRPFSKYRGSVPIGPGEGSQLSAGFAGCVPTTPRQFRAERPVYVGCDQVVPLSFEK